MPSSLVLLTTVCAAAALLWTVFNTLCLPRPRRPGHDRHKPSCPQAFPLVSVLVPLRNEVRHAAALVLSLKALTWPAVEVLFMDDSSDATYAELERQAGSDARFQLFRSAPLPAGVCGKNHNCQQLAARARGAYLFFIDADVRLVPDAIETLLDLTRQHRAALLTGHPRFLVADILSALLVPMIPFIVLFHLPVWLANHTRHPALTAASGALMFFERSAYEDIGGHGSVAHEIVEDIAIARQIKRAGLRVLYAGLSPVAACCMYASSREALQGFSKVIFNGLGRSVLLSGAVVLFYGALYGTAFVMLPAGLAAGSPLHCLPAALLYLQRAWVDWSGGQNRLLFLLLPFSIAAFLGVTMLSVWRGITGRQTVWKDRVIDHGRR